LHAIVGPGREFEDFLSTKHNLQLKLNEAQKYNSPSFNFLYFTVPKIVSLFRKVISFMSKFTLIFIMSPLAAGLTLLSIFSLA